mgnify:CR=1 FL=1
MLLQLFINQNINFTMYNLTCSFIKAIVSYCICFSIFSVIFNKNILKFLSNDNNRKELADTIKTNKNLAEYEKQIISEFLTNQFFKEKVYTFLKNNKIVEFKNNG